MKPSPKRPDRKGNGSVVAAERVAAERAAAGNRDEENTENYEARLDQLETLVEELIKVSPQEERIRSYMKAAGFPYSEDPIERMNTVLAALDGERGSNVSKGGGHGRNI